MIQNTTITIGDNQVLFINRDKTSLFDRYERNEEIDLDFLNIITDHSTPMLYPGYHERNYYTNLTLHTGWPMTKDIHDFCMKLKKIFDKEYPNNFKTLVNATLQMMDGTKKSHQKRKNEGSDIGLVLIYSYGQVRTLTFRTLTFQTDRDYARNVKLGMEEDLMIGLWGRQFHKYFDNAIEHEIDIKAPYYGFRARFK